MRAGRSPDSPRQDRYPRCLPLNSSSPRIVAYKACFVMRSSTLTWLSRSTCPPLLCLQSVRRRLALTWILHHNRTIITAFPASQSTTWTTSLPPVSPPPCRQNLSTIQSVALRLDITLAVKKLEGPSTSPSSLGTELDTLLLTAPFPQEKLQPFRTLSASGPTDASVRTANSSPSLVTCIMPRKWYIWAAGSLRADVYSFPIFFVSALNKGNSRHPHAGYDTRVSAASPTCFAVLDPCPVLAIRLNRDTRTGPLLRNWNGVSFVTSPYWSRLSDLQVSTDANGSIGFGAHLDGL